MAESLSEMLRVQEEEGGLHEVSVARHAPPIFHLFFSDDCFLFFRENNLEAVVIKDILREYGDASGQWVNFDKTSIVFGRKVHHVDKETVCGVLGVHEQQGRDRYLGLLSLIERRKREVLGFIRDKIKARIMHWENRFLSRGGREVILKRVLQSIPNYAMNIFLLPRDEVCVGRLSD